MAKILIAYYSRTGHTKNMAEVIGEAAGRVRGAFVEVRDIKALTAKDLLKYDAIVLGSPTYYGSMAAEVKKLLDDSVAFHGKLSGKVGGAFSSSANVGGGNETTILDMLNALLIHGMVIRGVHMGDHYGPVSIGEVDDRAAKNCRDYAQAVAELAVKLFG